MGTLALLLIRRFAIVSTGWKMSSSAIPIIARMQRRVSPQSILASTKEICD